MSGSGGHYDAEFHFRVPFSEFGLPDPLVPDEARYEPPYAYPYLLFQNWFPDAESDRIRIPIRNDSTELHVWVGGSGVSANRKWEGPLRIEEEIMRALGQGDALEGCLTVRGLDAAEVQPLLGPSGMQTYGDRTVALGRGVVKLLYEPLDLVLEVFRVNWGQVWINPFPKWDSRERTLSSYCNKILSLEWRLVGSDDWESFDPPESSKQSAARTKPSIRFDEFIIPGDWNQLSSRVEFAQSLIDRDASFRVVLDVLARSRWELEFGDIRHALIEGVTGFELALDHHLRRKSRSSALIEKKLQQLSELGVPTRFGALAIGIGLSETVIERTFAAIEDRNRVVHDGAPPSRDATKNLVALLESALLLLSGSSMKSPSAYP